MRVQKRNPWLISLGVVLAAMVVSGSQAGADVTSDRPGTVVIWPKVIADGTRDTLITLTNTSNIETVAHCEYVNGIGFCSLSNAYCTLPSTAAVPGFPACPGGTGDVCVLNWQSLDFDVQLTKQQPTIWRVSTGRRDDPLLPPGGMCEPDGSSQNCPGFFPIQVPAPVQPFAGELRCIQTNPDGGVVAANALKGEAILETIAVPALELPPPAGIPVLSTQISKYNSINVRANTVFAADPSILPLNGVDPENTDYNIFNACPESVEVTNYAAGAQDLAAEVINPVACSGPEGCPVTTEFTVIPCRADFEREIPTRFVLDIRYTNEFEQELSVERAFECWTTFSLEDLGFSNVAGSTFQRTRINPSGSGLCIDGNAERINQPCSSDANCVTTLPVTSGVCAPATGVLAVVEEFHNSAITLVPGSATPPGVDASNMYAVDANGDGFIGRLGRCRGALGTRCASDVDCPTGRCRNTGVPCSNVDPISTCGAGDFCDQCMNDEIRIQPDLGGGQQ